MDINLSLSGGAARGAYHLGVLQKLDEIGVYVKRISGASIGSFVAVAYASGFKPLEILEIIKTDEFKSAFSLNLDFKSFAKIEFNNKIIQDLLKFKRLEELKIPVYLSALDLKSGEIIYFNKGDTLKIVLGSCALIPIFEAVKYKNYFLADGGFKDNLPTKPFEKFKEKNVAVDLQPISNLINKYDISLPFKKPKFKDDFNLITGVNRALRVMFSPQKPKISKDTIYISSNLIKKYSLFSFKNFDELFELGYNSVNEEKFR